MAFQNAGGGVPLADVGKGGEENVSKGLGEKNKGREASDSTP